MRTVCSENQVFGRSSILREFNFGLRFPELSALGVSLGPDLRQEITAADRMEHQF